MRRLEGSGPGEAWTESAVTYLSSGGAHICTPRRGKDGTREAICSRTGFPESRLGPPARAISLFSDGSLVP